MAADLDLARIEEQLAQDLLEIHRESYGRGATHAQVHILNDLVVFLLDGIELLPNEEFMISAGRSDAVVEIRSRYQQAIEATFRAAVERATGRRVISFASNTQLDDPHWVIEMFRLGPVEDMALGPPDG